jgi:hypothetical protein
MILVKSLHDIVFYFSGDYRQRRPVATQLNKKKLDLDMKFRPQF